MSGTSSGDGRDGAPQLLDSVVELPGFVFRELHPRKEPEQRITGRFRVFEIAPPLLSVTARVRGALGKVHSGEELGTQEVERNLTPVDLFVRHASRLPLSGCLRALGRIQRQVGIAVAAGAAQATRRRGASHAVGE